MTEEEKPFHPELARPERYTLEHTTIEALTSVREMPGRMKEFPWPLELQGKGSTNEEEKSMLIRFPKGDIFLSFATTIHELGHLRQEELNPTLKKERQTHENLLAQEQDAWERGWQRFLKSNPDIATFLEIKFQEYLRQGKLKDFASFQELYQWIQGNALRMVEAQRILFDEAGEEMSTENEERFDQLADELEKADVREFLERYNATRVGEMVDEQEIRKFIRRTVELVIEE